MILLQTQKDLKSDYKGKLCKIIFITWVIGIIFLVDSVADVSYNNMSELSADINIISYTPLIFEIKNTGKYILESTSYYTLMLRVIYKNKLSDSRSSAGGIYSDYQLQNIATGDSIYVQIISDENDMIEEAIVYLKPVKFFSGYNFAKPIIISKKKLNIEISHSFINNINIKSIFALIFSIIFTVFLRYILYREKHSGGISSISIIGIFLFVIILYYFMRVPHFRGISVRSIDGYNHVLSTYRIIKNMDIKGSLVYYFQPGLHILTSAIILLSGNLFDITPIFILSLLIIFPVIAISHKIDLNAAGIATTVFFIFTQPRLTYRQVFFLPEMLAFFLYLNIIYLFLRNYNIRNSTLIFIFLHTVGYTHVGIWTSSFVIAILIAMAFFTEKPENIKYCFTAFLSAISGYITYYLMFGSWDLSYFKAAIILSIIYMGIYFLRMAVTGRYLTKIIPIIIIFLLIFFLNGKINPLSRYITFESNRLLLGQLNPYTSVIFFLYLCLYLNKKGDISWSLPVYLAAPLLLWYLPPIFHSVIHIDIAVAKARMAVVAGLGVSLVAGRLISELMKNITDRYKSVDFNMFLIVSIIFLQFSPVYTELFNFSPVPSGVFLQEAGIRDLLSNLYDKTAEMKEKHIERKILFAYRYANPIRTYLDVDTGIYMPEKISRFCGKKYILLSPRFEKKPSEKCARIYYMNRFFVVYMT